MAVPYRCPVCNGVGKVPPNFYLAVGVIDSTSSNAAPVECKSCKGTGLVWDYTSLPPFQTSFSERPPTFRTDSDRPPQEHNEHT